MTGQPEQIEEVRRWVEKAENDRRNAEYVLTMKDGCPTDTVCFHCQRHHLNDLKRLNRYSIETRYPGEWEDIAREEAAEALQATMRIRAAVRCLIPEAGLPIGNANAAELDQQGPADPDPL